MSPPPETALKHALHAHAQHGPQAALDAYTLAVAIREAHLPVDALARVAANIPSLALHAEHHSVRTIAAHLQTYRA